MTEVSVIIPTFNRAQKVIRAISSVLDQTFHDYEIIVVDDGSTDDTKDHLSVFKDKINIIHLSESMGVSTARNRGIEFSNTPFVAFLDSDDYWLPEKLATQVRFFSENPGSVICQTDEMWIRNNLRVNPRKKHQKLSGKIFEPSLKLCLVSPSAVMLKRTLLDEVGLFDEDFPVCEDYDLWLRISYKYPIELIDSKLVVKEGGHPDQLSSRLKGMDRFRIKAMTKILKRNGLKNAQVEAVLKELEFKCRVYGEGCLKRGKKEEGNEYLMLPQIMKEEFS